MSYAATPQIAAVGLSGGAAAVHPVGLLTAAVAASALATQSAAVNRPCNRVPAPKFSVIPPKTYGFPIG
jgi:hypothetical protein